jgi:pyruvate dehydrogenase E1 component
MSRVESLSFYKPSDDSPEMKYMAERRAAMGGFVPQRRRKGNELTVPELSAFENMLSATGESRNIHHNGICSHPFHLGT